MKEIWKSVNGFEGFYEVSNLGNIRSVDRIETMTLKDGTKRKRAKKGKVLKLFLDGKGNYLQANLSVGGKCKMVLAHRLVAMAFLPNPNSLPEVNHKDENKHNNCIDNLEWCDHKYNNNYGSKKGQTRGEKNPQNKFTEDMIRDIRENYIPYDKEFGATSFHKKYGISLTHVCAIAKGRRWGHLE